ncbi:MAG: ECF transporter S component [Ruminococcus sp.]|nr:ECF transporter S component [Ruminococcus sp.]
MSKANKKFDTYRLTGLAILTAIIIVLQVLSTMLVKATAVSITFALVPIVIGAAMYGVGAGAYLGAVFGAIVAILIATGFDTTGIALWTANPFMVVVLSIVKGAAAGFFAGLLFKAFEKKDQTLAVNLAAIVAPIANTGIFIIGMILFFNPLLTALAGGSNVLVFAITALAGVNFLIEFAINLILSPIIVKILYAVKKSTK